jgi:serine/threonine protein phosphatase 1
MNDFVKISTHTTGNRYAISDIHGCYRTFRRLVEEVLKVTKSDQLFLLGDYVDRGPSSKAVLDYIINLMESGFNIFPLRGNHEDDLLDFAKGELRFLLWQLNRHKYPDIVQDGKLMDKYYAFFDNLPYYYELDDYYLVHAGFDFKSEKPFENKTAMLWLRYFKPPEGVLNGKRVIHGHDPVYMDVIAGHIEKGYSTIPLDNGAVYVGKNKIFDTSRLGKLCAFDLDTEKLYTQKNIDMQ